jgi:hypothetical protein
MPLTAEELAEFARLVGYAVLQSQALEETLALHLVMVHKADAKAARRDVETMFAKAEKQTLGQLFRAIQDKGKRPSDLLSRLEHFVGERNWLIHRSRRENRRNLRSDAMRSQLIARITAVANEALSLMTTFQELTEAHLIARGEDRAKMQARADEIYRGWASDPG